MFFCVYVCVCCSPLSFSLLAFLVSTLDLKNTIKIKVFLLWNVPYLHTLETKRVRQGIYLYDVQIHQTPWLQPQWCTSWCIRWKSTHTMDVCCNVMSMKLFRYDSGEEAGVDCFSTHKSQQILSGCLLGGELSSNKNAHTVKICSSTLAGLLYVHAALLLVTLQQPLLLI